MNWPAAFTIAGVSASIAAMIWAMEWGAVAKVRAEYEDCGCDEQQPVVPIKDPS